MQNVYTYYSQRSRRNRKLFLHLRITSETLNIVSYKVLICECLPTFWIVHLLGCQRHSSSPLKTQSSFITFCSLRRTVLKLPETDLQYEKPRLQEVTLIVCDQDVIYNTRYSIVTYSTSFIHMN